MVCVYAPDGHVSKLNVWNFVCVCDVVLWFRIELCDYKLLSLIHSEFVFRKIAHQLFVCNLVRHWKNQS
jgi:hypothetical protein